MNTNELNQFSQATYGATTAFHGKFYYDISWNRRLNLHHAKFHLLKLIHHLWWSIIYSKYVIQKEIIYKDGNYIGMEFKRIKL